MKKIYLLLLPLFIAACNNEQAYDATGIFEATTVTVSAETSGKILEFPISEGDSIRAGQLIAQIDTTTLLLQRQQLASQRNSAQSSSPDISAQAAALRQQIAHQENECQRQSRLLAEGATTQKMHDDAQAALRVLQGQLTALLSTLGKSQSAIADNSEALQYQGDQIVRLIEKSSVLSPINGTVLVKYAEAGEYAAPGKPLCKLANLNDIYLRAYFTAGQLADLKLGQKVTVTADFGGEKQYEYPGTVTWIAQESEFTPKTIQTQDTRSNLVYAVKIRVQNDGRLKLGQYGEVKL